MKSLEHIKEENEKASTKYPRPHVICDVCKGELIVCYGNKITRPYLRHKTKVNHEPASETWEHQEAKGLIIEYLNSGGDCVFGHSCNGRITHTSFPMGLKYAEEVSFKKSQLDVAGMNSDGKVVVNLEIYHTHRTAKVCDRDSLVWVEVKASEVINKLSVAKGDRILQLTDARQKDCCIKTSTSLDTMLVKTSSSITNNYNDMTTAYERFMYNKQWVEDSRIEQLSIKLGYEPTSRIAEHYRSAAMSGKYVDWCKWVVRTEVSCSCHNERSCDVCLAWEKFLSYGKCMHCCKSHEVSYKKPYCGKCYYQISNEKLDTFKKEYVSDDLKMELRHRMRWLSQIPGNDSVSGSVCCLCKCFLEILARETSTDPYVWWFGEHKSLCYACLDKRLEADGVYDLELSKDWKHPENPSTGNSSVVKSNADYMMDLINSAIFPK